MTLQCFYTISVMILSKLSKILFHDWNSFFIIEESFSRTIFRKFPKILQLLEAKSYGYGRCSSKSYFNLFNHHRKGFLKRFIMYFFFVKSNLPHGFFCKFDTRFYTDIQSWMFFFKITNQRNPFCIPKNCYHNLSCWSF